MIENDFKLLWHAANQKLEASLLVNKQNSEDITKIKVQNFVSSMKPIKIFTLLVGIVWVSVVGLLLIQLYVNAYDKVNLFFLYSAGLQVVLTAVAVAVYMYQLDLIYKIDFGEPVIEIQEKLVKLEVSTLNVTRLLFLQLPLWTTFYWNETMFTNGNYLLWAFQVVVTVSFCYLAIWLFFNISIENRDKRWFQLIFKGREWQPILQSMELLNQLDAE